MSLQSTMKKMTMEMQKLSEESKPLPPISKAYMKILEQDKGFNDLKRDYGHFQMEVLAQEYIKNNFDYQQTILIL